MTRESTTSWTQVIVVARLSSKVLNDWSSSDNERLCKLRRLFLESTTKHVSKQKPASISVISPVLQALVASASIFRQIVNSNAKSRAIDWLSWFRFVSDEHPMLDRITRAQTHSDWRRFSGLFRLVYRMKNVQLFAFLLMSHNHNTKNVRCSYERRKQKKKKNRYRFGMPLIRLDCFFFLSSAIVVGLQFLVRSRTRCSRIIFEIARKNCGSLGIPLLVLVDLVKFIKNKRAVKKLWSWSLGKLMLKLRRKKRSQMHD